MAAEVCAACGKVVSMGMGVLMKKIGLQPGNGKGVERLRLENRLFRAENETRRRQLTAGKWVFEGSRDGQKDKKRRV